MYHRFLVMLTHQFADLIRRIAAFAYTYDLIARSNDMHNVVLIELPFHSYDTYRQKADDLV